MVQLSDDCFDHGGRYLRVDEALALIEARLQPLEEAERQPLAACRGRILLEDVRALCTMPPHDNAAVDGYAVRHGDLTARATTRLPVAGRIAAGDPVLADPPAGSALRIFTGAPMPRGYDTVFMQEDCRLDGGEVVLPDGIKAGANRRRAGEDFDQGATILSKGQRLRPQDLGLAAAAGLGTLQVAKPLRVALFSTGNELVEPGQPLDSGQIHDSNRTTLGALLAGAGCAVTDLGILEDREEPLRQALADAAESHDLLLTSGGVSVGEEDHVKPAVESLGRLHLWRLAIKPGRPLALGQVGRVPFIGLPGNPVAVVVTFLTIARPAILRLMGARETDLTRFAVTAGFDFKKKAERREWLRVRLERTTEGWCAHLFERQGSGILSSLVAADGLVELQEDLTRLDAGTKVDFLPFSGIF